MPTARWPTAVVLAPVSLLPRARRASRRGAGTAGASPMPAAVHLVTDILADNNARVRTFGFDSPLATRGFAAVKTGTSKDMRDNWCVGFTDRYTVGVWVGNASGAAMHDVSGISGAAPVWRAIVQAPASRSASSKPPRAAGRRGRAARSIRSHAVATASRPAATSCSSPAPSRPSARSGQAAVPHGGRALRHRRPRDGSIFALDPDIPPAAQRITFEGESGTWLLDGRAIGNGRALAWSPWPGRHRLSLRAPDGEPCKALSSRCAAPASSQPRTRAARSRK